MKKTIAILGSTGSIGVSTLSITDKKKKNFKIFLLSANKNFTLICHQIKKYKPKIFIISDKFIFEKVKKKIKSKKTILLNNFNQVKLKKKIDISISAIPGVAGLPPTVDFIKFSKKILIANKESIICGWNLIKHNSQKYKTKIVPVDSEHFSISKLLENHKLKKIKKIYITASGGPFLFLNKNKFKTIKPKDALKHPKWKMGKKITIDSATMMNKIFELIEAQKLFNIPKEKLDILIHPQSLVHAIIVLKNGLTKFLYHPTSMIIPISNAIYDDKLNIEDFMNIQKNKKRDIEKNLSFMKVNHKIFPMIKLKKKINEYPSTPIIINAANEVLVDQFLRNKLPFLGIFKTIKSILNDKKYKKYAIKRANNLNQIKMIDDWTKKLTLKKIKTYE